MPGNRNYTSSFTRISNNNQLLLTHLNNIKLFGELLRDSNELLSIENMQRSPSRINRNNSTSYSFSNQPSVSVSTSTSGPSSSAASAPASTSASSSSSASASSSSSASGSNSASAYPSHQEIDQYYFSLENLFPLNNTTTNLTRNNINRINRNNINNENNSFNILTVNRDNSNVLLNSTLPPTNEIYDITEYQLVQNPTNDICPITRDSFYNNQNVYMICKCKHIFNKTALNMWLEQNDICPYCRTNVRL
uniref:RING-type domain-containing protein n=1 Tax=Florenciella sp. virus SA2 TaxID=3240092 RepID=A0AB39JBX8_9VIRU